MTDFFDSSFLLALTPITLLGAISTIMLLAAKKRFASDDETVVAEINRVLPQTQCAQCGYPGCRPYAEAIAAGEAINRCPPGGTETIKLLGELLGRETAPLDPECGKEPTPHIVTIDESDCIGCTLCIAACPVDAITGAQRFMHTVIEARCTGCDLCIEPCPVDCIDTKPTVIKQPEPVHPTHDQPCINCGLCVTACPRSLQPQLLYRHRTDLAKSLELDLDACIECRLCDTHCPSAIPLTDNFKVTKLLSQIANEASATAAATESHYERRKTRLAARAKKVAAKPNNKDRAQLLAAIKGD